MADAGIEQLKALAHPARFRIVETLATGERNVGEIEAESGIAQPALSQQLAVLRQAGMVETRREAKLVFYSLDRSVMAHLRDRLSALAGEAPRAAPAKRHEGAANFARLTQ